MIDDESDPLLEMYGYVTGGVSEQSGHSLEQIISLGQPSVEQSEVSALHPVVSALHPVLGVLDIGGAVRRFFDNSP